MDSFEVGGSLQSPHPSTGVQKNNKSCHFFPMGMADKAGRLGATGRDFDLAEQRTHVLHRAKTVNENDTFPFYRLPYLFLSKELCNNH